MTHWSRLALICTLALALSACGGDGDTKDDGAKDDGPSSGADAAADGGGASNLPATDPAPDCDPLQPDYCALPWPSDKYLVADSKAKTGYALKLGKTTLPKNNNGKHIDPGAYSRLDGYGPGSTVLAFFEDLDVANLASETNPDASLAKDGPIVLLAVDAKGAVTRVPHFAELDKTGKPDQKPILFVRPLVVLKEATRYVVGFRNLKTTAGKAIEASAAFVALRDGKTKGSYLEARQAHFEEVFKALDKDGVKRDELVLAWDFVTASSDTLHGDLLHMRDDALAAKNFGPDGPELKVTKVEDNTKDDKARWALEIEGTFAAPKYIKEHVVGVNKGWELNRGPDGKPVADGKVERKFWIRVPHSALDGSAHGIAQYGHGLLGKGSQVDGGHNASIANKGKLIFFACSWTGMSSHDEDHITEFIWDMSHFFILVDNMHQGLVESLVLGRAMREQLFGVDALQKHKIKVDSDRLYYTGISQGGIYGTTLMALSQDIKRGHLGVPGQNYSILLHRSVDFAPFFVPMQVAYESSVDRAIILVAGQSLWDQVDPSSHVVHLAAEPFKDTPAHEVLMVSATADWQVALLTNEITARSGYLKLMKNYGKKVWGVDETDYPHKGSGLINYCFGNPWPRRGNLPPSKVTKGSRCGQDGMCIATDKCDPKGTFAACDLKDPHGKPRKLDKHSEQMLHFFDKGEIIDVCDGTHCDPCGNGPCVKK